MDYLIAALFGLSIGTLIAYSGFPPTRLPQTVAAAVLFVIGIGFAIFGPGGSSTLGVIVSTASLVALTLVDGNVWAKHPLLAGTGYWFRVWMVLWRKPMLRRALPEAPEQESTQQ
jgi:hypothetical protein